MAEKTKVEELKSQKSKLLKEYKVIMNSGYLDEAGKEKATTESCAKLAALLLEIAKETGELG